VAGDLPPHRRRARIQVGQREQLAVLHVGGVMVVVRRARRMEIAGGVQPWVLVLRVGRAVAADAGTGIVGHVIDDRVHVDAHPYRPAALHHVRELGVRAGAAARDAVAYRLIALAPVMIGGDAMLLRRRDLHGREAGGAEHLLAFVGDVRPLPFEEVYEHVARGHVATRAVGGRESWALWRQAPWGRTGCGAGTGRSGEGYHPRRREMPHGHDPLSSRDSASGSGSRSAPSPGSESGSGAMRLSSRSGCCPSTPRDTSRP